MKENQLLNPRWRLGGRLEGHGSCMSLLLSHLILLYHVDSFIPYENDCFESRVLTHVGFLGRSTIAHRIGYAHHIQRMREGGLSCKLGGAALEKQNVVKIYRYALFNIFIYVKGEENFN